ncbi:MAG: AAA family ATPase [Pseudomonadales bacterium]|nr:AAA family ATPase [Pseudomonadales bacterium]
MSFEDDTRNVSLDFGSNVDSRPLAERLRPSTITEYVGQQHLLGTGKPLAGLIDRQTLSSMILWGPPGTGKTTLAKLLANNAEVNWIGISAVLAGVKDVREAVAQAEIEKLAGRQTVLFVDEVHRFNKAQQDAFLPHVESGAITFIGATTENPSFEVNSALLSRARVFVLKPLTKEDLSLVIDRAQDELEVVVSDTARVILLDVADGDARRMLNVLEMAAQLADGELTDEAVQAAFGERIRRFDKGGDQFYDQISALHKSVRGSAPDAALYWFCRMLDGGADPRYIGRRLIRIATEDIGNADPRALTLTMSAVESFERLGSPEGELGLAQAVLYMASVPKSDSAYRAFNTAMALVKETDSYEVPMHIRNAPTSLMKGLGHGEGYRHAHGEQTTEGGYAVGETYFPEALGEQTFYEPTEQGLEAKIQARLARLRALDTKDGVQDE